MRRIMPHSAVTNIWHTSLYYHATLNDGWQHLRNFPQHNAHNGKPGQEPSTPPPPTPAPPHWSHFNARPTWELFSLCRQFGRLRGVASRGQGGQWGARGGKRILGSNTISSVIEIWQRRQSWSSDPNFNFCHPLSSSAILCVPNICLGNGHCPAILKGWSKLKFYMTPKNVLGIDRKVSEIQSDEKFQRFKLMR